MSSFMQFMLFILLSGARPELVAIAATEKDLSRTTLRRSSELLPRTPHQLRLFGTPWTPPGTPQKSPT